MLTISGELWLVGQNKDNGPWEVQGIYDSKEKAIKACKNSNYFIGPLELNKEISEMTLTWINALYPIGDNKTISPVRHTAKGKVVLCGEECNNPTPTDETVGDGQAADHWVLSPEERSKGYIRPVRGRYKHLKCGVITTMPQLCAETYAVNPKYYGSTWCCGCCEYLPVGEHGDFVWLDDNTKVGT